MKKTITILLLGCLCLNVTGYHIIFHFRKAALKIAMQRMLRRQAHNQDELVFHFPLNAPPGTESPEWEDDNEFSLGGKMYDVIEKRAENGKLFVRCISDEKEMELIKQYQEVLEKQFGNSAKKRSASLLKLLSTPFTIPSTFIAASINVILHNEYPVFHCNLQVTCKEVITPPPRII